jgi:uncharacterized RDD family membrane protein YckC
MVHDSVREELALKISPIVKTVKKPLPQDKPITEMPPPNPVMPPILQIPKSPAKSPATMEIMTKATSPTLIDFQNKNATLPDWRLQLQNSVRKRLDGQKNGESVEPMVQSAPRRVNVVTNGANALQAEAIEEAIPVLPENSAVKNAMKRIEESRRKYLLSEIPIPAPPVEQTTVKQFPLVLANKPQIDFPKQNELQESPNFIKPNIVQFSSEAKAEKFDTNKLPPLPLPAKISSSFEKRPVEPIKLEIDLEEDDLLEIHQTNGVGVRASSEPEILETVGDEENTDNCEEIEDYAPVGLRFNSALFDLLICSFLSLILLAPFMLLNGRFFSIEGAFAFLATCSIVMFIYLTTTIGFLGRTFGMRIFSLEIIDVEENDYPTLHQAAVSSSVYLLSLALGGIGFLTMLINREKRAAHDLLSGTIIVKEY